MSDPEPLPLLLRIGSFATLSGLSCRMLRFYAEHNILLPAYTDEQTGYRHYLPSQLLEARRLKELRRADLSVENIATLLENPEKTLRKELLAQQREKLQLQMEVLQEHLDQLDILEARKEAPRYSLLHTPPLGGPTFSLRSSPQEFRGLACRTLREFALSQEEELPESPFFCTYTLENTGERKLCIPRQGTNPTHHPEAFLAVTIHRGSCASLPRTLEELLRWTETRGFRHKGRVREWYFPRHQEETGRGSVELGLFLEESSLPNYLRQRMAKKPVLHGEELPA